VAVTITINQVRKYTKVFAKIILSIKYSNVAVKNLTAHKSYFGEPPCSLLALAASSKIV
jgi:hypothetical protein